MSWRPALRHAPDETLAAFDQLIATDDRLLATNNVVNLMLYIGHGPGPRG